MKGKRKANTIKWLLKKQFEAEAQYLMANRSQKASNRFLDAALILGIELEPAGRLAGLPKSRS
jgi:hypothetical protein